MATLRMKMRPSGVTRISSRSSIDQAVFSELGEARQLGREILVEVDAEFALEFVLGNHGVAKQAADYGAAQEIVVGKR